MHRRKFLLLSTASALAAMLPIPGAAAMTTADYTDVPSKKLEKKITKVFGTLEAYGFDFEGKARSFGVGTDGVKTLDDLQWVVRMHAFARSRELLARIECLTLIRQRLDQRLGVNVSDHVHWLATLQPTWRFTCRDLMETGNFSDLLCAAAFVCGECA
jgi:hypothetical protein